MTNGCNMVQSVVLFQQQEQVRRPRGREVSQKTAGRAASEIQSGFDGTDLHSTVIFSIIIFVAREPKYKPSPSFTLSGRGLLLQNRFFS
eukprot:scaffold2192_cov170-Amphora_coffeaeformis.AAC.26